MRRGSRKAPLPIEIVGDGTARLPLVNGRGHSLIDAADAEALREFRFYLLRDRHQGQYAITSRQGADGKWRSVSVHRLLMSASTGVDHINGDGLDNRRCNLRDASPAQNTRNRKVNLSSRTGLKGVTLDRGRYVARITHAGNTHHLGNFASATEAAAAYDRAALALHGAFARPNSSGPS